jgi:hypothetical protein
VDAYVVVYSEGESQPDVWPDVAKVAVLLQCHAGARPVQEDDGHGGLHQLAFDKLKEQLHKAQCEPVATA